MRAPTLTARIALARILTALCLGACAAASPAVAFAQTSGTSTSAEESQDSSATSAVESDAAATPAGPDGGAETTVTAAPTTTSAPSAEPVATTSAAPAPETAPTTAAAGAPANEEAAAEVAQAAREPIPWRNSFLSYQIGVTPNSFFRDAQLSYNPLVYNSLSLTPRWYLDARNFFVVSTGLAYEMTDDDGSSAYNHDVQLFDTTVDLRHTESWEGFVLIPSARVTLPTSKASQAAQRYFLLGAGLTVVRVIPEAWSMSIALIGSYRYWFADSNVPLTMGQYPAQPATVITRDPDGGLDSPTLGQASALTSGRHVVVAGLNLNVTPLENFNLTFSAFYFTQEGHGLGNACTAVSTERSGVLCLADQSPTHWRHLTSLTLSAAYDLNAWFNLSASVSNSTNLAPLFNDDGTLRGPFNPDTLVSLSATVQLDGLYESLSSAGEDDGLTPEQRQRRRQGLARSTSITGGSF